MHGREPQNVSGIFLVSTALLEFFNLNSLRANQSGETYLSNVQSSSLWRDLNQHRVFDILLRHYHSQNHFVFSNLRREIRDKNKLPRAGKSNDINTCDDFRHFVLLWRRNQVFVVEENRRQIYWVDMMVVDAFLQLFIVAFLLRWRFQQHRKHIHTYSSFNRQNTIHRKDQLAEYLINSVCRHIVMNKVKWFTFYTIFIGHKMTLKPFLITIGASIIFSLQPDCVCSFSFVH